MPSAARARYIGSVATAAAGVAIMVGAPVYVFWYRPAIQGLSDPMNLWMFGGLLGALVGLAVAATGGHDLYRRERKRRRFEELVEGGRKSALVQNIAELEDLARELPPKYRKRLDEVKRKYGIK